jgi:hypothetical protein
VWQYTPVSGCGMAGYCMAGAVYPGRGQNYSLYGLKRDAQLSSIRVLEIGLLQEAVIDENF